MDGKETQMKNVPSLALVALGLALGQVPAVHAQLDKTIKGTLILFAVDRYGKDIELTDPAVFGRGLDRVKLRSIDISDAFQVESLKSGYFSALARESATLLVTADRRLAQVARAEGLKSWHFPSEPIPA